MQKHRTLCRGEFDPSLVVEGGRRNLCDTPCRRKCGSDSCNRAANEPRLELVCTVFEVGLRYVNRVSWFKSESRELC